MQRELLEKLMYGSCDFVDKAMIVSRVKKTIRDVEELCSTFSEGIKKIQEENGDEYRMAGISVVLGVSSMLNEVAGIPFSTAVIAGSKDMVENLFNDLHREIIKE